MSKKGTLFFDKATAYQRSKDRNRAAGVKRGLTIIGYGIVIFAIAFVVRIVFSQPLSDMSVAQRELAGAVGTEGIGDLIRILIPFLFTGIAWIGLIVGAIAGLVGLYKLTVNIFRPTKVVTCEKCASKHKIYTSATKYMCTNCGELLLLSDKPDDILEMSPCPYCGLQTVIAKAHGYFLCPNCGIVRSSNENGYKGETEKCPVCDTSVPEEAIYCKNCQSILRTDFGQPGSAGRSLAYDQDWNIGKNSEGHLYFARALMKGIREEAGKADNLIKTQSLQTKLEEVLLSVEEAWQDPQSRSAFNTIMPEMDETYELLLERELRNISALGGGTKLSEEKKALTAIAAESYLTARRRIEETLGGPSSLTDYGSIGEWTKQLLDIKKRDDYVNINSYSKLELEIDRLRTWKGQRQQNT